MASSNRAWVVSSLLSRVKISRFSSEDLRAFIAPKTKSPETMAAKTSVNCKLEETTPH